MAYLMIVFSVFISFSSLLTSPTTVTTEERNFIERTKKIRNVGFRDREIDRLHAMIAREIKQIRTYVDKKYVFESARYYYYVPKEEKKYFHSDKEGTYLEIDLGSGTSFSDYPNSALYKVKAFIYTSEDGESLKKIILQYKRANGIDGIYVREIRRIINPSPNYPGPPKLEGEKENGLRKVQEDRVVDAGVDADDNNDIMIEYYTTHDGNAPWVDTPAIVNATPKLTYKLNDPERLLPITIQREIMNKYKNELHRLRNKLKQERKIVEISFKTMTQKLLPID